MITPVPVRHPTHRRRDRFDVRPEHRGHRVGRLQSVDRRKRRPVPCSTPPAASCASANTRCRSGSRSPHCRPHAAQQHATASRALLRRPAIQARRPGRDRTSRRSRRTRAAASDAAPARAPAPPPRSATIGPRPSIIWSSACACATVRGKPSSMNPRRASVLRQPIVHHADDELVRHQAAGRDRVVDVARRAAVLRAPPPEGCRRSRSAGSRTAGTAAPLACPCPRRGGQS